MNGRDAGTHLSRASGILLHVSSLPGRFGIGDLGAEAYRFVDFLAEHRQHFWQVLPLGPTKSENGHSPYDALSAFAGNPLFISLEALVQNGLLPSVTLEEIVFLAEGEVNYAEASTRKVALLRSVSEQFATTAPKEWQTAFAEFCARQQLWLEDYSLFMALRDAFHEVAWTSWEPDLVHRDRAALRQWRAKLAAEILFHRHLQFFFSVQWRKLKMYANQRGVRIIGDLPIYVGLDSAEVWSHPQLFQLDTQTGLPRFVSGVPPDAFSETGQRWGNPLYRWHDEQNRPVKAVYSWWVQRFRSTLELVDLVRIDHFRGFEAYWAIPADEPTAINGQWLKGPGARLFARIQKELGELPVIAEDLGVITPAVDALRLQFGFPGMKVLQFAFGGDAQNPHLPYNYTDPQCVVYTGTHDNDTLRGWLHSVTPEYRAEILRYLGRADETDIHWHLIRLALSSVAKLAIIPLQDILGLSSESRMNTPAQLQGNWCWRYLPGALQPELGTRLAELTYIYGRNVS